MHTNIINTSYLEISKAYESFVIIMFQEIYSIFQSQVRNARLLASYILLGNVVKELDGLLESMNFLAYFTDKYVSVL